MGEALQNALEIVEVALEFVENKRIIENLGEKEVEFLQKSIRKANPLFCRLRKRLPRILEYIEEMIKDAKVYFRDSERCISDNGAPKFEARIRAARSINELRGEIECIACQCKGDENLSKLLFDSKFAEDRCKVALLWLRKTMSAREVLAQVLMYALFSQETKNVDPTYAYLERKNIRLIKIIKIWCESFWSDWNYDIWMLRVACTLETTFSPDDIGGFSTTESSNFRNLDPDSSEVYKEVPNPLQNCSSIMFPKTLTYCIDFESLTAENFSRQLTYLDFSCLSLLNADDLIFENESELRKRPNVQRMVSHFNSLSYMVATWILREVHEIKRISCYKFFVNVAHYLHKFRNFHSLFAVMVGLDLNPVLRLKHLRHILNNSQQKEYNFLVKFTSADENYKYYRSEYLNCIQKDDLFYIPHLAVHLRDLCMLRRGCRALKAEIFHSSILDDKISLKYFSEIIGLLKAQRKSVKCLGICPEEEILSSTREELARALSERELLKISKFLEEKMTLEDFRRRSALGIFEDAGLL